MSVSFTPFGHAAPRLSTPLLGVALVFIFTSPLAAQDDERCADWAAAGYCDSDSHAKYMALHCTSACTDQEGSAGTADMENQEGAYSTDADSCARWAEAGYCEDEDYAEYMQVNCRAVCKHPASSAGASKEGVVSATSSSPTGAGLLSWLGWGRRQARNGEAPLEGSPTPGEDGVLETPNDSEHAKCVSWAKLGYCNAGANMQYMGMNCEAECEEGLRKGTIPEAGKLWQAAETDCLAWRIAGACTSHATYMNQHCEDACTDGDFTTHVLPPSDILSLLGAFLLCGGFFYTVFHGAKLAMNHDARRSFHTRKNIDKETTADTARLSAEKAPIKAAKKKSMTYQERMQAQTAARGGKPKTA